MFISLEKTLNDLDKLKSKAKRVWSFYEGVILATFCTFLCIFLC